jgi:hypothetical protein
VNPEQPRSFSRLDLVFALVGYVSGLAVMAIVWWIMEDMRSSMHQTVLATGDLQKIASFEAALQYDRQVFVVVCGLSCLVSAFFIWGLLVLRKRRFGA